MGRFFQFKVLSSNLNRWVPAQGWVIGIAIFYLVLMYLPVVPSYLYYFFPLGFALVTVGFPCAVIWSGWVIGQQRWVTSPMQLIVIAGVAELMFLPSLRDKWASWLFPVMVGVVIFVTLFISAIAQYRNICLTKRLLTIFCMLMLFGGVMVCQISPAAAFIQRGLGWGISDDREMPSGYLSPVLLPKCVLLDQCLRMEIHPNRAFTAVLLGKPDDMSGFGRNLNYTWAEMQSAEYWGYFWEGYDGLFSVQFDENGQLIGIDTEY